MLVYFMHIGSILWAFDIFYGHVVYFGVFWYIFPRFGIFHQEKSGNPDRHAERGHFFGPRSNPPIRTITLRGAIFFIPRTAWVCSRVTRSGEISPFGRHFLALGELFF
jgi:hypothetical protein